MKKFVLITFQARIPMGEGGFDAEALARSAQYHPTPQEMRISEVKAKKFIEGGLAQLNENAQVTQPDASFLYELDEHERAEIRAIQIEEQDRIEAQQEKLSDIAAEKGIGHAWFSMDEPLSKVIHQGKVVFQNPYAWVQEGCKEFLSDVIESPTYLDAWIQMDKAIDTTGDSHHVFLEAVEFDCIRADGVHVYNLLAGT